MSASGSKLNALIMRAEEISAQQADHDPVKLLLTDLVSQAQMTQRRLDRLVKRSDATEEKLFEANRSLETITENLSRFVPETVVKALMQGGQEQVAEIKRRNLTVFFSDIVSPIQTIGISLLLIAASIFFKIT